MCTELTPETLVEEDEVSQCKNFEEEDKETMVVVSDAGGEPHAMVVKAIAACVTQLAVLATIWNHNLKEGKHKKEIIPNIAQSAES